MRSTRYSDKPAHAMNRHEIREQAAIEQDRWRSCGWSRRRGAAGRSAPARPASRYRDLPRRASATISASVAPSRRPRLSPCAPIGGTTCAASPTSAMRRAPSDARGLDRRAEKRRGPARRSFCRAANARGARFRWQAPRPSWRKRSGAPGGSSTQTRLERRPGSGTSVNGPLSVWNSVVTS